MNEPTLQREQVADDAPRTLLDRNLRGWPPRARRAPGRLRPQHAARLHRGGGAGGRRSRRHLAQGHRGAHRRHRPPGDSSRSNEVLHDAKFQRLEGSWRSLHKLVTKNELSTSMRVRGVQREALRDREGLRPRPGLRPVADVQAYLRARVRHARRRALQLHHRRHGVRALAARHQLPQGGLGGGRRRPRAVHRQRQPPTCSTWTPSPTWTVRSTSPRSSPPARWRRGTACATTRTRAISCSPPLGVLQRLPWGGPNGAAVEGFDFVEEVDGEDHSKYLWGGASWDLGGAVMKSFASYGWPCAIRGTNTGGKIADLPLHTFESLSGARVTKCPTETAITDRREKELSDQGIIGASHAKNTDYAVISLGLDREPAEDVRGAGGEREFAALGESALHPGLRTLCALSEGDHARPGRRVHVAAGYRGVSQPVDRPVRHRRRRGEPRGEGGAIRCARRGSCVRDVGGEAGGVRGDRASSAALPARGADRLSSPGCGASAHARLSPPAAMALSLFDRLEGAGTTSVPERLARDIADVLSARRIQESSSRYRVLAFGLPSLDSITRRSLDNKRRVAGYIAEAPACLRAEASLGAGSLPSRRRWSFSSASRPSSWGTTPRR